MLLKACKLGNDFAGIDIPRLTILSCPVRALFELGQRVVLLGRGKAAVYSPGIDTWPEQAIYSPPQVAGIGALLRITHPSAAAR